MNDIDPAALEHSRRLVRLIEDEAHTRGGRLPFDRFMELALYAPGLGYYVAGTRKFGPGGDFVTAPEISPLFGQCIAAQFAEVAERLGTAAEMLELGAGSGRLAVDVLGQLARSGTLPRRYLILEPSAELAERQQALIGDALPDLHERVQWIDTLPAGFSGMIVANEVLDAMPVHRFSIGDAGEPLEVYVNAGENGLAEIVDRPESVGLDAAVRALHAQGLALAPGYTSEINLRLGPWLAALADGIERGLVLLIDYGYPARDYYTESRSAGTLVCHHHHQLSEDPYRDVGLQDITAHVDFSAVARHAKAAGLDLTGYTTQAHFLIGCGFDQWLQASLTTDPIGPLAGAKQLILPGAMGERFQVIGLAKALDAPSGGWRGFSLRDLSSRL